MTLKLKLIEIANIRLHEYVRFEPETDGITAISGPNGSGKSTVVDSFAWALYGTKPQGVKKVSELYRAGAVFGEDKCYVRVVIELDGQVLKVERRMTSKNGAAEADVWEKAPDEDDAAYRHMAGSAVSHVERYIRGRLKMDEKGFLSAILVQQKQVDQLIAANPRERASVIEKLTGISSVTAGLIKAREEYNILRKTASVSTIDEDELGKLEQEAEALAARLEAQQETERTDAEKLALLTTDGKKLRQEVDTASAAHREAEELRHEEVDLQARLEGLESNLAYVQEEKTEKKKRLSRIASSVELEEVEGKLTKLRTTLRQAERERDDAETLIARTSTDLETAQELVSKTSFTSVAEAEEGQAKLLAKAEKLGDEISAEQQRRTELLADAKKFAAAAKIISQEHGACPTCLQHVENVDVAVAALQAQQDAAHEEVAVLDGKLEKLAQASSSSEAAQEKYRQLIAALGTIESSQVILDEARETQATAAASAKTALAEVQSLERVHLDAKRHEETKQEYSDLLARAQKISDDLETVKTRLAEVKADLASRGALSSSKLEKLRTRLDEAKTAHTSLTVKLTALRGENVTLMERQKFIAEKAAHHSQEIAKYRELLKSVEVASSTVTLLDEFRENRIKNSIPLLEVYASDLLNRFTSGKFTRLIIDGKFNTTVVLADGSERAVGLLSGGELSAAAIALRIGVAMLLHSGASSNLIILDEVLVSQDTERAELILSTVKEVCQGQVLLIAHNDAIDAIADKVFDLGESVGG